jgi:hypothetical protein
VANSESKPLLSIPVVFFLAMVIAAAGILAYWNRSGISVPQGPGLTAEAKSYVRHLKLSEVEMKAIQNAIGQEVVEIVGNITNTGDRHLNWVQIHCVFYDAYGQLVLRERVEIVRARLGGLPPGATKPFRLPFDSLPLSWNQAMPQLVIASIQFG